MKVFIGYDPREETAYQVCRESLARQSSTLLNIQPIKQSEMREKNLYWREKDALSSTEFSFTRFLVPYLAGYTGWAIFMDCDFLWRGDIAEIEQYIDPAYAACVVKHDYKPKETTKMDGQVQTQYPRKNWSSFVLWNCGHFETRNLSLRMVNERSGLYLHRFNFLSDEFIGELPIKFNYLEGWYTKEDEPNPLGVHFTRGGPWFKDYVDVEYGDEWVEMYKNIYKETSND
jgi:lipopolysaccharide biosynthesis glycosyltransferase